MKPKVKLQYVESVPHSIIWV